MHGMRDGKVLASSRFQHDGNRKMNTHYTPTQCVSHTTHTHTPTHAHTNTNIGSFESEGATKQFRRSERVKNINLLFAGSVNDLTEIKLYNNLVKQIWRETWF